MRVMLDLAEIAASQWGLVTTAQARATGAAYAPYLFDAVADGDDLVLRYTLSTWNPYQVVLMRHRLPISFFHP